MYVIVFLFTVHFKTGTYIYLFSKICITSFFLMFYSFIFYSVCSVICYPRADSFNPRGDSFNPRGDRFNPRGDSFNPRGDSFNPQGDSFNPRGDSFRRASKC